jgi:hypothetical protein
LTKVKQLNFIEDSIDILDSLKDKEIMVYEEIEGSTIYVKWIGERFIIKPKSLRNEPLNFIDLATQKFYNKAYEYFNTISPYVTELLNKNWWFCFEYFPENDTQPANIEYDKIPENNLILKCIVKGTKYRYYLEEIREYSRLFKVDPLPIMFKGKLSGTQLEKIQLFLKTSEDDLNYVFGEDNFAKYFYSLLNPDVENSFLMNNDFNNNMKKLVIKLDNDDEFSFEILNPSYERLEHNNSTEYVDIYSLILVNFLEYGQLVNINNFKLKELTKDELYIELICKMFNEYIENIKDDIIDKWVIDIPPFFQDDKFKININFIKNKQTQETVKNNSKIEYLFKCILGSFSKPKKKTIGIFNDQTLKLFNNFVKTINIVLDNQLNINREHVYQKSDVKNFKDFWDLKYSTDANQQIYPDVYDLHDELESDDKKKKKKKPIMKKKSGFSIEKEELE